MQRVLLIIPAYNEEDNILNTYNKIKGFQTQVCGDIEYVIDYIVINDGSTDSTGKILKENQISHINLIHNLGIGGAVQTGYKYAKMMGYDYAIQFDGDGQHDAQSINSIMQPLLTNQADMVIGSRFIDKIDGNFQSSRSRRMGIQLISAFMKFTTKKKIYDTTSGFRAVNKSIIFLFANEYPTEYPEPITTTECILRKFEVKEVAVVMHEREGGKSSITSWKPAYYMINVLMTILIMKLRRY